MTETADRHPPLRTAYPVTGAFGVGTVLAALIFSLGVADSARAEAGAGSADSTPVGVASREAAKRQEQIRAAQELFTDAELDNRDGNHGTAVEKYRTAFLATPNVPAAAPMRESIFKRYQQGTIAWAEQLVAEAKWKEAEAALVQLMNDAKEAGFAAGQIDPKLRTLLTRLRSDDYFNKALSPEHLANVGTVEKLLTEANGFFEIGDFSTAKKRYEAVLNVDRYNSAARRGLEKVEQIVGEYEEVARNQTRSTMIRQVAEGWEAPVPQMARGAGFEAQVVTASGDRQADIQEKLNRLILPQVQFDATPLESVIEYLVQTAQTLDAGEPDPSKRGINIVVEPQSAPGAPDVRQRPITLRLTNAPLGTVLKYVTDQAQLKYRVDAFAVTIVPLSSANDTGLVTRTYQVPPGFITGGGAGAGAAAAGGPVDPFAAPAGGAAGGGGTLVKRISPKEFLENNGVTFPEGALASFNAINSSLVVKNTADNHSLIEQLVISAREGGSKLVRVEFKLIETTDRVLNELGFDWLLGQFNAGSGGVFAGGGSFGNQAANRGPGDYPFVAPGGGPVGGFPVTGGLRSGLAAQTNQTIDDIIRRDSPTTDGTPAAPGVLSLAGVFTDPQFQVVLRAISQHKGVDMLCSAAVVTRPGEKALIKQVREFIYPTEYDPPEIPNQIGGSSLTVVGPAGSSTFTQGGLAVTPANPAAFETRELGKILEIEPVVGGDNLTVDLNLIADISDFVGFINYGSPIYGRDQVLLDFIFTPPFFITQPVEGLLTENRILMPVFDAIKETTQVSIYDGQTIIVGGLLNETVSKVEDKVPVLGDAPLVGRLFSSEIEERSRRALVLFASVRILDPGGKPLNDLSQISNGAVTATAAR
ncbi:MAG: hypothetical protein JNK37_10035 [Verrucomicrobiales bacterium]|nr:hypothetical protein [Verrucomicrobiales bacterium]